MREIKFKATRRSSSGWRILEKSGDLAFDREAISGDIISLRTANGAKVAIDCDGKTGVYRIFFDDDVFLREDK